MLTVKKNTFCLFKDFPAMLRRHYDINILMKVKPNQYLNVKNNLICHLH